MNGATEVCPRDLDDATAIYDQESKRAKLNKTVAFVGGLKLTNHGLMWVNGYVMLYIVLYITL